jgi:Ion transport protein
MKTRSLNKNPFEKKITFLNSTIEDLKNMKIGCFRLFVAKFMRSKPVEIFIILLIIIYTLLVVVYLAIDNIISSNNKVELGLQIFELVLLFVFWVETVLNFIGFGMLFVKDYWNIVDISVILLAVVLVILDISLSGSSLDALIRLRGLFRLVRIGILLRKFDAIRKKNAAKRNLFGRDFYHVMAPAEIVNNILCNIRDMIQNDAKLLEDINYWIKMVSSGKLYETNFGDAEGDETDDKKKDAMSWVKSIQGRTQNEKRGSAVSTTSQHKRITNNDIEEKLDLTPNSK